MRSVGHNLQTSPFLLVIWMWHVVPCSTHAFHRSSGPTQVNWGQLRSNEVNDLCRLFRVLLPSKVIWGADFDSDIHFALRMLVMRSWNHRVIKGQWRHMTQNSFFEFLTPKNYPRAFQNHSNVFYSSKRTRWTLNFRSSSIRSKVIGDHGFSSISALDLTSEVTGWPRTLRLYINLFVSRRATRSFFPRSSSSIRGEMARGVVPTPPPPCAVEGCEMACASEG